MSIFEKFKRFVTKSRDSYALELQDNEKYWSLSALTYQYHKDLTHSINRLFVGDILDAGAGSLNGKRLFKGLYRTYKSLDIVDKTNQIDFVGDIQNMVEIPDGSFDTVYSSQVLEHIPYPGKAIKEFQRVLKEHGICIISVPHISHYHEVPHDYFRFTEYGLAKLLSDCNFEVLDIKRQNGLIGLLTHPVSILLISVSWGSPLLRWPVFYFNKVFIVLPSILLDKIIPLTKIYPINILVVAQLSGKPDK